MKNQGTFYFNHYTANIYFQIVHMRNATLIYLNLTIQGKQTRKILRKHTAQ